MLNILCGKFLNKFRRWRPLTVYINIMCLIFIHLHVCVIPSSLLPPPSSSILLPGYSGGEHTHWTEVHLQGSLQIPASHGSCWQGRVKVHHQQNTSTLMTYMYTYVHVCMVTEHISIVCIHVRVCSILQYCLLAVAQQPKFL